MPPLIDLTLQHGQSLDEACRRMQRTVNEVRAQFGAMIQRVDWADDRTHVKITGFAFWLEMTVDGRVLHATGDIPVIGQLLSGDISTRLGQVLERTFLKKLPP